MSERKSDFESPPRSKIRVVAVIDKLLEEEIERIHEAEIELCRREDRNEPDWGNTLEILLRKEVRATALLPNLRKNSERILRLSGQRLVLSK
jgi:hypothetical protein